MYTQLLLSTESLYPITKTDDTFHQISNVKLFSSLITSSDFSSVMSKLQWMKQKNQPIHLQCSIKTFQGPLPVFMEAQMKNGNISITLKNHPEG